jgi:hypothetical protein
LWSFSDVMGWAPHFILVQDVSPRKLLPDVMTVIHWPSRAAGRLPALESW